MSYLKWPDGVPPRDWKRLLACDVGGSSPWAFEFSALDPWDNLIFYEEIYKVTTDVELLAQMVLPLMKDANGEPYNFLAKVIDYENKIAAEDLHRRGITFTNAQKMGKSGSIARLSAYLHPNPKHQFPEWHPRAGEYGSPRLFVMSKCKNLASEFPQQRWKEGTGSLKDEADRNVIHNAWDCALYTVRQLPHPSELKPTTTIKKVVSQQSLMSEMYWHDRKKAEAEKTSPERRPYRIHSIIVE